MPAIESYRGIGGTALPGGWETYPSPSPTPEAVSTCLHRRRHLVSEPTPLQLPPPSAVRRAVSECPLEDPLANGTLDPHRPGIRHN